MKRTHNILFACCLLLLAWVSPSFAQVDTEFWFAAPSIAADHRPQSIHLVIVAYDDDAVISISQPAAGRTLMASRQVPRHSTYSFDIQSVTNYRTTVETAADGQAHPNAILLKSTARISAYYVLGEPNSEVYSCKGGHALGTEFVVPMQSRFSCAHAAYASSEILATVDNTTVTITSPVPTNLSPTAGTFTVTLNRGETYAVRAANPNTPAARHLGGMVITANKPIAVNTTDDSPNAGGQDLVGEQLVPTDLASSRYILPANNTPNEYAYFFAVDDTVRVYTLDDTGQQVLAATVAPGQGAEYRLTRNSAHIFYTLDGSSFVCFHLTDSEGGGELSGTILPSLTCSGSQEVSYVPNLSTTEVRVTVLTRTENVDYFTVNGSEYELSGMYFAPVPGDSTWSYCVGVPLTMPAGNGSLQICNSHGLFHIGILDFEGGACSYGYFSNFGHISLFASLRNDYYMAGDTVRFHLTGASDFDHITWTDPNGNIFAQDVADPYLVDATEAESGMYIVSAEHSEGCPVSPDTIYVNVFSITPSSSDTICAGDSIRLKAMMSKPLTWYEDGSLIEGHTSRFLTFRPEVESTHLFQIDGKKQGAEMIQWVDTLPLSLSSADSLILAEYHFDHMIVGAEYTWEARLEAPVANTVAPKLRFYIDDVPGPVTAVPNGATIRMSHTWTATATQSRLRLVVISPRPERSLRISQLSLRPVLTFTELHEVVAEDCKEPEPECPDLQTDSLAVTLCDTLLPYLWHEQSIMEAGLYTDTLRTTLSNGVECDSIIYYLDLTVEVCRCEYEFIAQRWDDVLFLLNADNNGGYTFTSYRWYRNGTLLEALTDQSYVYVPDGLTPGDSYEVEVVTTDGVTLRSCPYVVPTVAAPVAPSASSATKQLLNGRIVILRDGHLYQLDGQRAE